MLRKLISLTAISCCFFFTGFAQVETEKENQAGISQRLQLEIDMTKDPALGYVPKERLIKADRQRTEMLGKARLNGTPLTWTERGPYSDAVGPSNGNTRPGNGKTSGRMRAIWQDISDATGKTVWVGGMDGGLWKTNDVTANPATWNNVNDFFGNLAIGAICQDPTNPNIMYFGTGEKAINADAVRGAGVWYSTDHGVTWAQMPNTASLWNVSKILCDASGNLYVSCNSTANTQGLQRYTKSTATWTNITPTGLDPRVPDMDLSSTGRLHITCGYYNTATASSGYRYTDNPATVTSSTWTSPATTFPTQYNVVLKSNGNTLYALSSNSSFEVSAIYKSTNGGANWATVTLPTTALTNGQAWYDMSVGIDPNNANNVIVGGLDAYRTTNGGTSWTKISNWVGTTGQYIHADQHTIVWSSLNQVFVGSDGGLHYSADGGTTFSDRNVGLRIKQFYSVAVHPTSTNYFLAGAQDNGTHQLNGAGLTTSVEVTGGDGAFVHIDQDQPQYQWGAYVYNQYRRSTDGGNSWSSINISSSAGRFINPTDYDNTANIMYCSAAAGAYYRWNAQSATTATSVAVSLFGTRTVSAVKVSPYTANLVFFGANVSSSTPVLVKAVNANATGTFTNIIGSSMNVTSSNLSCIELGTNDNNIIATFSNYGINNVWITSDGGTTWTAIDGNLPDMPVRWAMFYPGDNTKAIIATETGVWTTSLINGAATIWDPETGFPNVRTDMLQYRASDGLIAASTHGRGIFTAILTSSPATCGTVTGLNATGITTTGATLNWAALSGAVSYDVDYKLTSGATWTNAATATTSLTAALTGLTAGTSYDFRVRANCASATGAYSLASFSTAAASCGTVTGLAAGSVTTSSATVSWTALSGALNYDVDYKLNTSATWTNAATATTSLSAAISGLSAGTLYDYRVRANCTGATGAYASAQFTTTSATTCGTVTGLTATGITTSGATLGWAALSGATSYDVNYKLSTAITWTNAATATTSLSVAITGLSASSVYDYQVRANCGTIVGSYTAAQFTTAAAVTCPGIYDVSTNGTTAGAAAIPFNTNVYGLISPAGDVDYYKFTITTAGTATITLTNLPANYDLTIFNSAGTSLATSKSPGTTSESITGTFAAGTYYAQVVGKTNANNATTCYILKVQLGTATAAATEQTFTDMQVKMFPNPARGFVNVYVVADNFTKRYLVLTDANGRAVHKQLITDLITTVDVDRVSKGLYLMKIVSEKGALLYSEKLIKN